MRVFLIDYENVDTTGLDGISALNAEDRVVIFYSDHADRMTFGLHRRLNETKAQVEYKKVEVGKPNALDIQLATFLGYLVAKLPGAQFVMISKDNGFEMVSNYWKRQSVDVSLQGKIQESVVAAPAPISGATLEDAMARLKLTEGECNAVQRYLRNCCVQKELQNSIRQKFGKNAQTVYDAVSPFFTEKPQN